MPRSGSRPSAWWRDGLARTRLTARALYRGEDLIWFDQVAREHRDYLLRADAAEFEGAELVLYTRLAVRCERELRDADSVTRRDVAAAWCR